MIRGVVITLLLMLCACTKTVYMPSQLRIVDHERTSLVPYPVHIDRDVQRNVTAADSSFLENRWCTSSAVIDSAGLLHHDLTQKDTTIIFQVKEVDRLITRDSLVYVSVKGDTIIKEITPKWCWWLLLAFIGSMFPYLIKILKLFK